MPGMCVPMMDVFEHDGYIEEERAERKKNERKKQPQQKRSKSS